MIKTTVPTKLLYDEGNLEESLEIVFDFEKEMAYFVLKDVDGNVVDEHEDEYHWIFEAILESGEEGKLVSFEGFDVYYDGDEWELKVGDEVKLNHHTLSEIVEYIRWELAGVRSVNCPVCYGFGKVPYLDSLKDCEACGGDSTREIRKDNEDVWDIPINEVKKEIAKYPEIVEGAIGDGKGGWRYSTEDRIEHINRLEVEGELHKQGKMFIYV